MSSKITIALPIKEHINTKGVRPTNVVIKNLIEEIFKKDIPTFWIKKGALIGIILNKIKIS